MTSDQHSTPRADVLAEEYYTHEGRTFPPWPPESYLR